MKNITKCLIIILCGLASEQTIITAFLFHDGEKTRAGEILEYPALLSKSPDQLTEGTVFVFADPNSKFATEARIVTISASPAGNQWMVSSTVIQNADSKTFDNLENAQMFALSKLQPNAPMIARVREKVRPQDRQKWRRT